MGKFAGVLDLVLFCFRTIQRRLGQTSREQMFINQKVYFSLH